MPRWVGEDRPDQWHLAIGVRHAQPTQFGKDYRLNDRKALQPAVLQIEFCLLAGRTVEELPCSICKPEEWPAIAARQVVAIRRDGELVRRRRLCQVGATAELGHSGEGQDDLCEDDEWRQVAQAAKLADFRAGRNET